MYKFAYEFSFFSLGSDTREPLAAVFIPMRFWPYTVCKRSHPTYRLPLSSWNDLPINKMTRDTALMRKSIRNGCLNQNLKLKESEIDYPNVGRNESNCESFENWKSFSYKLNIKSNSFICFTAIFNCHNTFMYINLSVVVFMSFICSFNFFPWTPF